MTEDDIIELSRHFERKINCELKQIWKAKKISYVDSIQSSSWKLWKYKNYIETKGLQLKFWEDYTKAKYYLSNSRFVFTTIFFYHILILNLILK